MQSGIRRCSNIRCNPWRGWAVEWSPRARPGAPAISASAYRCVPGRRRGWATRWVRFQ
jgi:hypothetical protein